MLNTSAGQRLATLGLVMGVALVVSGALPSTTFGADIPQTITCTGAVGHVRFLPGLTETLPAGTLERVNFHLNLSGCSVTGGAPVTTSGRAVDLDGSSRRYPLSRTVQASKGLCGLGWEGETAWKVTWNNHQDVATEATFQTLTIGADSSGNLAWTFGPSNSRATGSFIGDDEGGTSQVSLSASQSAGGAPTRCFQKVTLKSLAIASGSFHVG